ncbi:MAG: hypothetical protein JWN70_7160 [Planctomycetaceae bacterium]|nr:hypothetical protein [Planctomycetaceae bacterium]
MLNEINRRDVLSLAAAWGLSFALPPMDLRAAQKRGSERVKSLIILWMAGGPSQLETWDPHPGTKFGGEVTAIKTKTKGLEIADLYPLMAEQIQDLNVVRSLVTKEGDHERGTYMVKTGYRPDPTLRHPTLGAILETELPLAGVEIPRHIALGDSQWPSWGGFLGAEHDAFKVYNPGYDLHNMQSFRDKKSQARRLENLSVLENAFQAGRQAQAKKTLHSDAIKRALQMMSSEQLKAFKIQNESESTRKAYGDSQFGRGCLVARRLVEEGVRSVEVTLNGWDSHARNMESHRSNAAILDPAFAALMNDLRQRDLLQSTVVLCIGEFGRTPQINPLQGRDHWPTGFSCVIGGGGLKSGMVIGQTDPESAKTEPSDPILVPDLYATILKLFGIEYNKEVMTPIGRPMAYSSGKPISRLLG